MTRKIRGLWAVLAVLALLAGACGDDSGDEDSASDTTAAGDSFCGALCARLAAGDARRHGFFRFQGARPAGRAARRGRHFPGRELFPRPGAGPRVPRCRWPDRGMALNADFASRVAIDTRDAPWIASPEPGVERKLLDRVGDRRAEGLAHTPDEGARQRRVEGGPEQQRHARGDRRLSHHRAAVCRARSGGAARKTFPQRIPERGPRRCLSLDKHGE